MLLALETSGKSGSTALIHEKGLLLSRDTDPSLGSAQTLAASIRSLLQAAKVSVSDLRAIAVTVGPGSFTGLRVGVATAKTMAYGLGIPTIAVDSLAALLRNGDGLEDFDEIWAVMDAYRGEVFVAGQRRSPGSSASESIQTSAIIDAETWAGTIEDRIENARRSGSRLAVVGTGLGKLKPLASQWARHGHVGLFPDRKPTAREVAVIGMEFFNQGKLVDPFRLMPIYLRASAAEEKLRTNPAS